ncbi:hypothetical protein [Sphingomonas sp. BK235]|uniref:hypothetical protein n=1 Tax=Sphingomonas sp. BK235 TaxID=2512131 RepID=UPI00104A3991|nr:hypothetical protein [Sphingomonas sp. BK235]TCP35918.1 hypothetical protein EV292_102508 [Sphingomonas sp. BK235]
MSLADCVPALVRRGEIDAARGARMTALFEELERYYRRSMGADAAAAEASEATLRQLAEEARLRKRQTLLQAARQRDCLKDLDRFNGKNRYSAVSALLDDDDRAPYRGGNVMTSRQRILFQAHARVAGFIEHHRRDLLGKAHDAEGLNDVVRELHAAGSTDNARAKLFAQAIGETFEQLRQRFNAAGGNIRRLAGFGLPHRHDALKVRAAGRERWLADVTPLLDRSRMIDERTGVPFTDAALRETLEGVWETIRTNGLSGDASAGFGGAGKLANRRGEHRFLHFRDGDAWLQYDRAYGSGANVFTTVTGHLDGMAKDIAIFERLGPNPDEQLRFLLDHVNKGEAQSDKTIVGAVRGVAAGRKRTENLWRYIKGESNIMVLPEGALETPGFYAIRTVQGTRNLLTASQLGSALLSAPGDALTGWLARKHYGLPAVSVLTGYLKQLNPLSGRDRALATRLGLGMMDAAHSLQGIGRHYGQTSGPGWTSVAADDVMRVSLLNRFTEAGQNAFGLDLLGTLGDHRGEPWDQLPRRLRRGMEYVGLDRHDWQSIRLAEPVVSNGIAYVDPQAIRDPGAADRLMNMLLRGRAEAVPEVSASARALMLNGTNPGTFWGEMLRNGLQFKGFSVSLMMKTARVLASLPPRERAAYAAQFVIGLTLFGAATIQLREIAKGHDPRPMDNLEFWRDAALQGGGIGVVGDLLGQYTAERVDLTGFIGGPVVGLSVDLAKAAHQALPGAEREDGTHREGNPGAALTRLVQRYTPGGNIWYLRAAFERLVIDQLMAEHLDPEVEQWRERQRKRDEKNHQGEWWAPGEAAPSRAPEWMNAWGGEKPA